MSKRGHDDDDYDELDEAAKLAADMLVTALRLHEREDHDGGRCTDERVNLIAYVVHRVGLGTGEMAHVVMRTLFYREEHERTHDSAKVVH